METRGTPTRPNQPNPRALLARFNHETPSSHVYSMLPHKFVLNNSVMRPESLDYVDWNWHDVRFPVPLLSIV